ncbi:MAG: cytidylate kinase-like family protein [Eubacteriales bacterium]|nr:cytidylate kinase-like family protein [Eubacteriales bacterium]
MKNIITISREFGAGGGTIGKKVAKELGYYYCDKDIILQAAAASGSLTPNEIRRFDEKVPFEFGFGQSLFDFYNKPLNEKLFAAQREAIIRVAEKGNCVIVGRNANVILQEFDRTLHVFVSATQYFRIQNLKTKMPDMSEAEIISHMKSVDKTRKKYCSYYTKTKFGQADYYDMCLKSSTLGIDGCVDLICRTAEKQ